MDRDADSRPLILGLWSNASSVGDHHCLDPMITKPVISIQPKTPASPQHASFKNAEKWLTLFRGIGATRRNKSCQDDEINVVHCTNQCVVCTLLCRHDPVTGTHYEHHRE